MSNQTCYTIVPITTSHIDEVFNFFKKFFYRDEPLNAAIGLLNEPNATFPELKDHDLSFISEGLSIMAISSNGDLLGVCLNGSLTRNHAEDDKSEFHHAENCADPKFKKIQQLLSTVEKEVNIFARFPEIESVLDIKIVSVDGSCRGQGICKALFDNTIQIAKQHGFSLIKVDCTSQYSAKAVSRLGFQCIFTLKYDDYVDEKGEKIFNVKSPHTCIKTFVMPVTVNASSHLPSTHS